MARTTNRPRAQRSSRTRLASSCRASTERCAGGHSSQAIWDGAVGLSHQPLPVARYEPDKSHDCKRSKNAADDRCGLREVVDLRSKHVSARAEHDCPNEPARRVERKETPPGHAVRAGKERGVGPENGDEAAEEHDLAAVLEEEVLAELEPFFVEADEPAVPAEQPAAPPMADRVTEVVPADGSGPRQGGDQDVCEPGRAAGLS